MLTPPSFHHLHLNSVDPDAAIDFYTDQFATTKRTTWGGFPALDSPNHVLILFTQVPTPPAVVVRYLHPFSEVLAPASGIAVTFTPSNGTVGSGLLVTTVTTATDGTAATPWRLGTVGANLLIVTAAAAGSPDTIRATGTTPIL